MPSPPLPPAVFARKFPLYLSISRLVAFFSFSRMSRFPPSPPLWIAVFIVLAWCNSATRASEPVRSLYLQGDSILDAIGVAADGSIASQQEYQRKRETFLKTSPDGAAIIAGRTGRLLTTSVSDHDGSVRLCEWDYSSSSSDGPLRCAILDEAGGSPRDMAYLPARDLVLVVIPERHAILAVRYSNFSLGDSIWFDAGRDSQFRNPSAIEYDSENSWVFVSLEGSDSIWRITDDGRLVTRDWAVVPRPKFLMLDRHATPPSLYSLTADVSLPELHRLRLSDAASISTSANMAGEWYPSSSAVNNDSLWTVSIDSEEKVFYALWEHSNSIDAFSLASGSRLRGPLQDSFLNQIGNQTQLPLIEPVAIVRDEWAGSVDAVAVVDAYSWRARGQSHVTILDGCSAEAASGATLDLSRAMAIDYSNSTTLMVADDEEVFTISLGDSKACFEQYLWRYDPASENRIAAVWLNSSTGDALLRLTHANPVIRVGKYRQVTSHFELPRPLSERLFQRSDGRGCTVDLSNGTIYCENNHTATIGGSLLNASLVTYDATRDCLFAANLDGSFVRYSIDSGAVLYHSRKLLAQSTATPVAVALDGSSGIAAWISQDTNTTEVHWHEWDDRIESFVTVAQFKPKASVFAHPVLYVNRPEFRFVPRCPGDPGCREGRSASLWVAIGMGAMLLLWIVVIGVVCFRKKRSKDAARLELQEDDSELVDSRPTYLRAEESGDYREYEKRGWKRTVRRIIRRLFCFCRCCYNPVTGNLRCCYSCLRGRIDPPGAQAQYTKLNELGATSAPQNGFVRVDAPVSDPGPPPALPARPTILPSARSDPYLGSGTTLQTISLEDGKHTTEKDAKCE